MRFILLLVFSFGSLNAMSSTAQQLVPFGVTTLHYRDEIRNRPIGVEYWFPKGEENEKLPLILMSHGHGGARKDKSWLAERLAGIGYRVASVEHFGNSTETYDPVISLRFWERSLDISFVLTELLKTEKIDRNRVGFVGYSLGGMTGLSLAGAKAQNLKQFAYASASQGIRDEFKAELFESIDFAEGEKSYADPRIKCMFLICPATFVFSEAELKKIKTPIGLVAAIYDEVLPHQQHALRIIRDLVPAKLKLMRKGITHGSFVNGFGHVHREVGPFIQKFFQEQFL
jgi:predicted dienelactone hydrolase